MNLEQRIEEGLRRRPFDEPIYSEPLAVLADDGPGPVRMTRVVPRRTRPGAAPVLVALVAVLTLGTAVLVALPRGSSGVAGPTAGPSASTFALTGRIACFGQAPGYDPNEKSPLDEGCQLMPVPPNGYGAASWTLDPSAPYSAGSTDLHILVMEQDCASGSSADGRIVQNVEQRDGEVVVTIAVRTRSADINTCQGNPSTAYVVHLDRPVGNRTLLDGGLWPARVIARAGTAMSTGETTLAPTLTPTASPAPSFRRYTVVAGDYLSAIATENGLALCELLAANPDMDPNRILPGDWINIPMPGTIACAGATPAPPTPAWTYRLYQVRAGDMLSAIAAQNNLRLCELVAANPGITPDHIEVGQWIKIPIPGGVSC